MQLVQLKPTTCGALTRMAWSKRESSNAPKRSLILRTKSRALNNNNNNNESLVLSNLDNLYVFHVQQVMEKQAKGLIPKDETPTPTRFDPVLVRQAYETCRQICAEHSTSYYLGSLLMTQQARKAIWAVYAWCQKTDDLVDKAAFTDLEISQVLDRWEKRLEDIFNGCPHDLADTALADTVHRFSLDIQPFKDLIKGMRMDTWKNRYENYQQLELYCYYVAVAVGLMVLPIIGISPHSQASAQQIYKGIHALGIANQLTNILRDVAEDAERGRIYLPQDELREFGLTEEDIFKGKVTENWREFTKKQVERARSYYDQGEFSTSQLQVTSRRPVLASMMLNKKILDKIEENNYDNLTKRATVGNVEKFMTLPLAYAKAMGWCPKRMS